MYHEKIFKRADGNQVKLRAKFYDNRYTSNDTINYEVEVYHKDKGKRIWKSVSKRIGDEYAYRKLSVDDRRIYEHHENLKLVTEDEIFETKLELWEMLKPTKG